ncbi:hypothetical protein AU074_22020 [Pseudomonas sp. ATCC PTA-122608]|uniref:hypothetical protein n=1 Tax=Pseudomonas sp. ATCC PTA-122608 TaxID=1771311 RepID=UPI00096B9E97|nr:hypothetical protein [Pseudomonas sp. ATCC PTA-122608]OLY75745.1 hypothetical protein AU074_22020 [Pseudomonas sp. ATCC PTA-122608]
MSVKISFDNELAVASIPLADWAPPLVEHLGRYFDVSEGIIRLNYAHLSAENTSVTSDWPWMPLNSCQNFAIEFEHAARQGPIALTLAILGHGPTGIKGSSSILDENAYESAEEDFRKEVVQGDSRALRETIMAAIAPCEKWVSWLLDVHSSHRSRFLDDREIMAALVTNTSKDDCIDGLQLVAPRKGQNSWAFEQMVEQHWQNVRDYLEAHIGMSSGCSGSRVPDLVFSLFASSPKVQASRWACEQVLDRVDPTVFPRLIQHCRAIVADDVRSLFLRWHILRKTGKKDEFKECVAKACSTLATLMADTMPSDLALAAAWHKIGDPARSDQQGVAASLRELPSGAWDREALWSELGPAAREAWRQDLFDQVRGDPELAHGLLDFACLWLEQVAFAEVEPVFLRLMDDEDHLAFANRLASAGPRQLQLRAKGLVRSRQGALDLEGPVGQGEDATALPRVGAQTWLCDPSVERVIHGALSQVEEEYCREYLTTWGEDEEAHTARLLALTQEAVGNASRQLRQLSATTRATYPSLSVKVRQPSKREEGANTPAGAPLGADVLFLTRIVDKDETVIQRATLVQVKKRSGTQSGSRFSSTIGINLQQCEDMLKQSEHAYYLFATPPSSRPTLWVAPARLVRNLTQLHTSKASVVAIQVRDASCSYADFFLHDLVGLWAGDEHEDVVAIANGDPRLGRTPRHIVEIEVRRQSDG